MVSCQLQWVTQLTVNILCVVLLFSCSFPGAIINGSPHEWGQLADHLHIMVAQFLCIGQKLLFLTAEHTERLWVEVLQQGQLYKNKHTFSRWLFTICTEIKKQYTIVRLHLLTCRPLTKLRTEKSWYRKMLTSTCRTFPLSLNGYCEVRISCKIKWF